MRRAFKKKRQGPLESKGATTIVTRTLLCTGDQYIGFLYFLILRFKSKGGNRFKFLITSFYQLESVAVHQNERQNQEKRSEWSIRGGAFLARPLVLPHRRYFCDLRAGRENEESAHLGFMLTQFVQVGVTASFALRHTSPRFIHC